jgi:hypothetical protein
VQFTLREKRLTDGWNREIPQKELCGCNIVMGMKSRMATLLALVTLWIAGFAQAWSQAASEKSDPLSLAEMAVTIAANTQHQDFDGFFAIYVSPENWDLVLKDGDLGPFLKVKEKKPGRSAVILETPSLNSTDAIVCIYFDGNKPFGMTAIKRKDGGKTLADDIASAYKPVAKSMTQKKDHEFEFVEGNIRTDNDDPLPAYKIKSVDKKPAK